MNDMDANIKLYQSYLKQEEYNSDYLINDRSEIQRVISGLANSKALVSVYLHGSDAFYITAILGMDLTKNQIYFDIANEPGQNRLMETGGKGLVLFSKPNQIRSFMYVKSPIMVSYNDKTAFMAPMPQHMVRLQRREYLRINPMGDDSLNCTIHVAQRTLSASIYDISEGGLNLMTSNLPDGLGIGDIMPECQFVLPGENRVEYNLKIKRITHDESDAPHVTYHLGCEYVNPEPTANARLRQYIWQTERSSRAAENS